MGAVDEIKERLDIVEVISAYVPLKKAGRNYKGLCPFHSEKTPSFVVFPETGTWHCFGACGTGGDLFTFIMRKENMTFGEALRFLASKAGVTLEPPSERKQAEDAQRQRLLEILSAATLYYHNLLLHAPAAQVARDHLTSRHLEPRTWQQFQLGYAPGEWRTLSAYLLEKGYTLEDLVTAGLVVIPEGREGHYDRFRHRLIIPIRDRRGQVVAFGARALDPGQEPKYLNSPQSPLFDKGRLLFGLDSAWEAIRATGRAVIVEGYMDVLMARQHGIENVVATMGTALTEAHLSQLARLTSRIVLAMDADEAGNQATLRGLNLARETMRRRAVPVLTPTGQVRFEERLDLDLRILALPSGRDPDEVIHENPEVWERLVEAAVPVVDYYFQVVLAGLDLSQAQDKSRAVKALTPIIRDLGDEVQREHYVQRLARLLRVSEQAIRAEMRRVPRQATRPTEEVEEERPPARRTGLPGPEELLLGYLVAYPHLLPKVDRYMREELGMKPFSEEDFQGAENRLVFSALASGMYANPPVEEWEAGLDPDLQAHAERLRGTLEQVPPMPEELVEQDAVDCALRLRKRNLKRSVDQLRYLLEDPSVLEGPQRLDVMRRINEQNLALGRLDKALEARSQRSRWPAVEPGSRLSP
ncbi:MAG: DNA primase [Anaerolineae bacterium]